MVAQKLWNEHEAAVLLHYYLQQSNGELSRQEAIEIVSETLRALAKRQGLEIDEIFRNINGIKLQMMSVESAYTGEIKYIPATKLFTTIVELYHRDREAFNQLLAEVKEMLGEGMLSTNQLEYDEWLANSVSPEKIKRYQEAYDIIDEYGMKTGMIQQSLLDITDGNQLKKIRAAIVKDKDFLYQNRRRMNRIYEALHQYITFVEEFGTVKITTTKEEERSPEDMSKRAEPSKDSIEESQEQVKTEEQRPALEEVPRPEVEDIVVPETEKGEGGDSSALTINFRQIEELRGTKPTYVSYFGEEMEDISSWGQVYTGVLRKLYEDYENRIPLNQPFAKTLTNKEDESQDHDMDLCTEEHCESMHRPQHLVDNLYVEMAFTENALMRKLKTVLDLCLVDYENIVICYAKEKRPSGKGQIPSLTPELEKQSNLADDTAVTSSVEENTVTPSNQLEYEAWLANRISPETFKEYQVCYEIINEYCMKPMELQKPLLETTEMQRLENVRRTIERSKMFKRKNRGRTKQIHEALDDYIKFVKTHHGGKKEHETAVDHPAVVIVQERSAKEQAEEKIRVKESVAATISMKHSPGKEEEMEDKPLPGRMPEDVMMSEIRESEEIYAPSTLVVDFKNTDGLTHTKPIYASYFGAEIEDVSSWTTVYVEIMRKLYEDYPDRIPIDQPFSWPVDQGRFYYGYKRDLGTAFYLDRMHRPKRLVNGIYAETALSTTQMVKNLRILLYRCLVDEENVVIRYVKTGVWSGTMRKTGSDLRSQNIPMSQNQESQINLKEEYVQWLAGQTSPGQFEAYQVAYEVINGYCMKPRELQRPVLETTDLDQLNNVRRTIERSKLFKRKNQGRMEEIYKALDLYIKFVEAHVAAEQTDEGRLQRTDEQTFGKSLRQEQKEARIVQEVSNDRRSPDKHCQPGESDYVAEKETSLKRVDFQHIDNLAYTSPLFASYFDEKIEDISTWTDVYVGIVRKLWEDYEARIPLNQSWTKGYRMDICEKEYYGHMGSPRHLVDDLYVETGLSAEGLMRKLQVLLGICSVDEENVIIQYTPLEKKSRESGSDVPASTVEKVTQSIEDLPEDSSLERYKRVLQEHFDGGYRIESFIDRERFKNFWEQTYRDPLSDGDDVIDAMIQRCGIVYEEKLYVPENMLDENVKHKLFSYIEESFQSGRRVIEYEALFEVFNDDFLGQSMYDAGMLKAYLNAMNHGSYHMRNKYLAAEFGEAFDVSGEIKCYLTGQGAPVAVSKLQEELPHFTEKSIRTALNQNKEFIANGNGSYFHETLATFSEDDLTAITDMIQYTIDEYEFISVNELLEWIKQVHPSILEQNSLLSGSGFKDAIAYQLKDKFSFRGNVISPLGEERLNTRNVFEKFSKRRDEFTLDELKNLSQELGTNINFEAVYAHSLRISEKRFVTREGVAFDGEGIDEILDRFCVGDYITLSSINQFGLFPETDFPWNHFLLESYVSAYSPHYRLVHAAYAERSYAGAIVKKDAAIETMDELVTRALADSAVSLDKPDTALGYLRQEGYLARKTYRDIDRVLIKAQEMRNRKEL